MAKNLAIHNLCGRDKGDFGAALFRNDSNVCELENSKQSPKNLPGSQIFFKSPLSYDVIMIDSSPDCRTSQSKGRNGKQEHSIPVIVVETSQLPKGFSPILQWTTCFKIALSH